MTARPVLLTALVALLFAPAACENKPKVKIVKQTEDKAADPTGQTEEQLREAYEKRQEERKNTEPELDPKDPREKLELVWANGRTRLDSLYSERADMLDKLGRVPLEKKDKKVFEPILERLGKFGLPKSKEGLEKVPAEICTLVSEVRVPMEKIIEENTKELEKLAEKTKELEAKADAGGTVYQRQWDKLDEEKKVYSLPTLAARQVLLVLRSVLDEGFVLCDLGARRVQIALRDCLTEIKKQPLALDLAQESLDKTLERCKWYRLER